MDSFDLEDLKGLTYLQSMNTAAQIELQSMLAANRVREINNEAHAYNEEAFMGLIDKYGLGHNSVVSCLSWSNR